MSNWKMADWNLHAPEFVPGPPPQPSATSKPMDLAAQQGRGLAAGHPVPDNRSFAAFWNLCPSCTEDELRRALTEIDFVPDSVCKLKKVHTTRSSAFGVSFLEPYSAVAAALALDAIDPTKNLLPHCDEIVHVAECKIYAQAWWVVHVPQCVQNGMADFVRII